MIDRLLQIHLEPVARDERRRQLLHRLAVGWLAASGIALLFIIVYRSTGWVSPWLFLFLAGGTILWTLLIWRRSMRRPLDFHSIARNIEAENPKLHALLLTAVEQQPDAETHELSYLQGRVIREALAQDRRSLWRKRAAKQLRLAQLGNLAALALLATMFLTLYQAAPPRVAILKLTGRAVTVTPGDASIEKGSSLVVLARFEGDVPAEASLIVRPANEPERRITLTKNLDDPVFGTSLPEVSAELTYRVEYGHEQTRDFRLTTFEFPRLERADAKVTYPDYTGLPAKTIEDTRRVSAVEGSTLDYTFHLNKPVKTATLVELRSSRRESAQTSTNPSQNGLTSAATIDLLADTNRPNVYTSNFKLEKSGRYELILVDEAGRTNKLPPLFVLDALTNRAPELKFAFPKGDQRVSALEEIAFKAEASDDFGLTSYGFAYNLAGQETKFVELGTNAGPHEKRNFDQLVPLEDLGAQADQLLSYYLWAEDFGPDGQPRRTTSDMYFAEVRPFEEIFREGQAQDPNQQQQQQQQGQQGQNQAERLAELQKQIITATWNLQRRETGKSPTPNFKTDAGTVKESQEKALEQVRSRMEEGDDPRAKALLETVAKEMAKATEHLTDAADDNSPKALPPALSAEQSAYQALLRLAAREIQVAQGQPGQQGQSSRGQRAQRQLNQLDLRQSQNRYETERQAAPPQDPQQREQLQAFNRLKELAQRQQDVNERLKELQAALQAAQSEPEREELRQRLKRLQEEQQQMLADVDELRQRMERPENQSQMAEARQQLDQTRDQVQQASDAMQRGELSQALSSGTRAQRDLQQMRDDFRKQNSSQFADDMRELRSQARELAQQQEDIGQKLDALNDSTQRKTLTDSDERKELASQLDEQKQRLDELVKHATDVTQKAEPVEPLLSRQLYDTLRKAQQDDAKDLQETSDDLLAQGRLRQSVYDRLRESRRSGRQSVEVTAELLREGFSAEANNLEQRTRRSLNELKTGVDRAAESVLGDDTEALRLARDELEELSRQLERELAQAQRGANTNRAGSRRGDEAAGAPASGPARNENDQQRAGSGDRRSDGSGNEQQAQNARSDRDRQQAGEGQQAQNQSQPGRGQQQGEQREGQGQSGIQPGQQAQSGQQGQNGQRGEGNQEGQQPGQRGQDGQGQGTQQVASATQSSERRAPTRPEDDSTSEPSRSGDRRSGNQRGSGSFLDQFGGDDNAGGFAGGPITGAEYTQWTDRLRDVEEMLDVPELRAEAARIRDRMRNVRQDLKRHAKEPQWDLVKMNISAPLVELRTRVAEELARRQSKEALVPIDRDPVPTRYSELVRRYYEELGKSEPRKAADAGGVK